MSIEVKSKYVVLKIDVEKIRKAFGAVCDDAHGHCAGSVNDMIYLSYHQCRGGRELLEAQALLKTVEMAEMEGCIQSDEKFSLQAEYDQFFEDWGDKQKNKKDERNRPDPYQPGDWRKGK
jgi:hypothetical protein